MLRKGEVEVREPPIFRPRQAGRLKPAGGVSDGPHGGGVQVAPDPNWQDGCALAGDVLGLVDTGVLVRGDAGGGAAVRYQHNEHVDIVAGVFQHSADSTKCHVDVRETTLVRGRHSVPVLILTVRVVIGLPPTIDVHGV